MLDLLVIIVSWKVKENVRQLLTALPAALGKLKAETVVVDNDSGDGTAEMVAQQFMGVKLIANSQNVGFSRAVNQAWQGTTARYVLLLNPDVVPSFNSLEEAVRIMDDRPAIGVMGCQLKNPDGTIQPSVRRFPALWSQLVILFKLHNFWPRLISYYAAADFDYSRSGPVASVMGAWFLARQAVWEEIGLLDEGFWIWFEEVDYCKRVFGSGWTVWYEATITAEHGRGRSFAQLTPWRKQRLWNASLRRYFRKHQPLWQATVITMASWLALLPALAVWVFGLKKRHDLFTKIN